MQIISRQAKPFQGIAHVPGDKSISHRALMFGAIAVGETVITGLLEGEDALRTAKALISLGAHIAPPSKLQREWHIYGAEDAGKALQYSRLSLNMGNSGTSARLLMGLVSGYTMTTSFSGDASLVRRPMGRVIKPLAQMGVQFEAMKSDKLPLRIVGPRDLRAITYTLPVASAQVKSAILLAGLRAKGTTTIIEPVPTRDHSERMLNYFGVKVETVQREDGANVITMEGGQRLHGRRIHVPRDPSSAAFPVVAALMVKGSDITVPNIHFNPTRAGLYETLQDMGADITYENEKDSAGERVADLRVRFGSLQGVVVPPERVPSMVDEFPILFVLAAFAKGKTVMTNLSELRVKESDRLAVMAEGLKKVGVKLEMGADSMTIYGGDAPEGGCVIDAQHDHRIAMSFMILGMAAKNPVTVTGAETFKTSFPTFLDMMNGLGAQIEELKEAA